MQIKIALFAFHIFTYFADGGGVCGVFEEVAAGGLCLAKQKKTTAAHSYHVTIDVWWWWGVG
jgi:hypothetical protein